ncbi:MAG: FAD-dependent oxidoreductase, partial [Pseudomonadota bacterium]
CMGGEKLGARKLSKRYGLDAARHYYACQAEAVELVRSIAADARIEFNHQGEQEMVVAEKPSHYNELAEECDFQRTQLGAETFMLSKETFSETHYDAPHQHGAMVQRPGFGLHPLKYCLGLGRAAQEHGAKLHDHSKVVGWEKSGSTHKLVTDAGGILRAKHIFVACNGFLEDELHSGLAGRALPLQSQIIVTRPLSDNELSAHGWKTQSPAINSRKVYQYYRMLPDNRFMIGGRADFKGTPEGAQKTKLQLGKIFNELWPEWRDVEIEYDWRGFVCFTSRFTPTIGRLPDDPSVHFAFGYHGSGVSNATWSGRELARWLATGNDQKSIIPKHLPAPVHGLSQAFPLPSLRPLYAKLGVGWEQFKDNWL